MQATISIRTYLTFFFHSSLKTLPQPTISTLVSLILVHNTVSIKSTSVHMIFSDRSSKKSFAAIAWRRSIMLPCCSVPTNCTKLICHSHHGTPATGISVHCSVTPGAMWRTTSKICCVSHCYGSFCTTCRVINVIN